MLCDVEDLSGYTSGPVRDRDEWVITISTANDSRENYWKILKRMTLFNASYGANTVTLNEIKAILKAGNRRGQTYTKEDGFKEVRSR